MAAHRLLFGLLAAANFAVGLGAFVVIGILTPLAQGLGIDRAAAGALMTTYAVVYAVSSPVLVALTGRVERRVLLVASLLLFAAGALAAVFAPSLGVLHGARVLMALGGGLLTPVAASTAVAMVPASERGRALATVFGGLTLAQALGVPVGSWLGYALGWRAAFAVVAGVTLAVALALRLRMPTGIAVPVVDLRALGRTLARPRLVLAVSFTGLFIGGLYVVYTYLGTLLEERHGLGRDGVAAMLLVFGFGAVVGNALGGRLTDRIGPVPTLLALCGLQVLLLPLLTAVALPLALTVGLVGAWSSAGWSFMVPQQARLAALEPPLVPVLFALNASAIYVGAALGSALGGHLLLGGSVAPLGFGGAALMLLAAASVGAVRALQHRAEGARGPG